MQAQTLGIWLALQFFSRINPYIIEMRLLLLQEILDDLENDDNENECGVCDNEREKHSSDESEVADEINLNKS